MLLPQQYRITEEAKSTYPPLRKAFEKQTKTIKKHEEKQVEAFITLDLLIVARQMNSN